MASEVTSGKLSKRGATRGGALLVARPDFLGISALMGTALPLDSFLGLLSSSLKLGLVRDEDEDERLDLMWLGPSEGEFAALVDSSFLTTEAVVGPVSGEASRFVPLASWLSKDAGVEALDFVLAIVIMPGDDFAVCEVTAPPGQG